MVVYFHFWDLNIDEQRVDWGTTNVILAVDLPTVQQQLVNN